MLFGLGLVLIKRIRMYASNPSKLCWWVVFVMVVVGYNFVYGVVAVMLGSVYNYHLESIEWSLICFIHINISEIIPMFVLRSALRMRTFPRITESEEFDSIEDIQRMMSSGDKDSLMLLRRSLDFKKSSLISKELEETHSDHVLVLD